MNDKLFEQYKSELKSAQSQNDLRRVWHSFDFDSITFYMREKVD